MGWEGARSGCEVVVFLSTIQPSVSLLLFSYLPEDFGIFITEELEPRHMHQNVHC